MTFEEWCDKERLSCQYSYQLDALEDAWNAAIAFHACKLRPMVPEGYVLVPVEPTDTVDKIDNIITLLKSSEYNGADLMTAWLMLRRYKAMIQAAQEEK